MKRKHLLIAAFLCAALLFAGVLSALRGSLSLSVGVCLMTEDGRCLLVLDDMPVVIGDRTGRLKTDRLVTGQRLLVLHDGIQETYPARTGAYAVIRLGRGAGSEIPASVLQTLAQLGWQPAGSAAQRPFPVPVVSQTSWANYRDPSPLWDRAINKETADPESGRLPLLRFDSADGLASFLEEAADLFETQHGYDEVPSLAAVTAAMDADFFRDNVLFLTYVAAGSCTWRYAITDAEAEGGCLTFRVQRTDRNECGDCAMAGWFLTAAVARDRLGSTAAFDAVMAAGPARQ